MIVTASTFQLTDNYKRAAEIIGKSFQQNRIAKYVTSNDLLEHNIDRYEQRIRQLLNVGAQIAVDNTHSAVAVWLPPDVDYPECNYQLTEREKTYEEKCAKSREYTLKDKRHWNLIYLAQDPDRRDAVGAIHKVLRPFLQRALDDNIPVCSQAICEREKDIFWYYGFEIREVFELEEGLDVFHMVFNHELKLNDSVPTVRPKRCF